MMRQQTMNELNGFQLNTIIVTSHSDTKAIDQHKESLGAVETPFQSSNAAQ